jgi:hypothetical protein
MIKSTDHHSHLRWSVRDTRLATLSKFTNSTLQAEIAGSAILRGGPGCSAVTLLMRCGRYSHRDMHACHSRG